MSLATPATILDQTEFVSRLGRITQTVASERADRVTSVDVVMWGVPVRSGFDELDDASYHHGDTAHMFVEGNDQQALCGFRLRRLNPFSGPSPKLGMLSEAHHTKCATCEDVVGPLRSRA